MNENKLKIDSNYTYLYILLNKRDIQVEKNGILLLKNKPWLYYDNHYQDNADSFCYSIPQSEKSVISIPRSFSILCILLA